MRRLLPLIAVAVVVACGGDSSGPGTNVAGSWLYSVSNLTSGSLTCSSSGTTLSITQTGNSFSGSYSGGTLTCITPSGSSSFAIGGGAVVSGSISGTSVSFDLDTSDWHNSGTITGGSMSGTVTVHLTVDATTYTLTGNFGAARSLEQTMIKYLAVLLGALTSACAAAIHTSTDVTYLAPTPPVVDSLAILPVSSGEGLEGFRRMISDSLFTMLSRDRRDLVLLPADTTLSRINRAGLTAQYATAICDYQQTSVLTRGTIDMMSRQIGSHYLLYTRAAYEEGRSVAGNFFTGYSSRRDQNLMLHLHVWDARAGDVVWEAVATGKVSAGELETSRGVDEILAASVRELVARFLTRPLR